MSLNIEEDIDRHQLKEKLFEKLNKITFHLVTENYKDLLNEVKDLIVMLHENIDYPTELNVAPLFPDNKLKPNIEQQINKLAITIINELSCLIRDLDRKNIIKITLRSYELMGRYEMLTEIETAYTEAEANNPNSISTTYGLIIKPVQLLASNFDEVKAIGGTEGIEFKLVGQDISMINTDGEEIYFNDQDFLINIDGNLKIVDKETLNTKYTI